MATSHALQYDSAWQCEKARRPAAEARTLFEFISVVPS